MSPVATVRPAEENHPVIPINYIGTPPLLRKEGSLILTKNIADFVHEGFVLEVFVFDLGELFEELALFFCE